MLNPNKRRWPEINQAIKPLHKLFYHLKKINQDVSVVDRKGCILTNEQIEKDSELKRRTEGEGGYHGSQDTGDTSKREYGTDVQK